MIRPVFKFKSTSLWNFFNDKKYDIQLKYLGLMCAKMENIIIYEIKCSETEK